MVRVAGKPGPAKKEMGKKQVRPAAGKAPKTSVANADGEEAASFVAPPPMSAGKTPAPPSRAARAAMGGKKPMKPPGDAEKNKRKHRFRPGTVALRQIRRYQKSVDLLIPKLSIKRLIREIAQENSSINSEDGVRFQKPALEALHEAAEAFLVNCFESAQLCAIHGKRITINSGDIALAYRVQAAGGSEMAQKMCDAQRRVASLTENDRRVHEENTKSHREAVRAKLAEEAAVKEALKHAAAVDDDDLAIE